VIGALSRNTSFDFVQAAHEALAALMACAHAKYSGGVGVCLSTGGPGALHMLNGLYGANLDHQPVVAKTLWFASEATAQGGRSGTVDGALMSGQRAARQIMTVL
jgi:thiamine pyrophosphate-dependent acetolactate synthase large subunit-like protein